MKGRRTEGEHERRSFFIHSKTVTPQVCPLLFFLLTVMISENRKYEVKGYEDRVENLLSHWS